jgi:hypothetical protein
MPFLLGMAVLAAILKNCVETDTPLCLDAPADAAFIPSTHTTLSRSPPSSRPGVVQ